MWVYAYIYIPTYIHILETILYFEMTGEKNLKLKIEEYVCLPFSWYFL